MRENGHLSANERLIEELRAKQNLYSAIIMLMLEERDLTEHALSGAALNSVCGKLMVSVDYNRDLLKVSIVPEEMKRIIT